MNSQFGKSIAGIAIAMTISAGAEATQDYSFDFGTALAPGSWGETSIGVSENGSLQLAFGTRFGVGAGKGLTANEGVSRIVSFTSAQKFFTDPAVSPHIQGLSNAQGESEWYPPATPVPEPETYAMLLVGLGLLGVVVRRRMALMQ